MVACPDQRRLCRGSTSSPGLLEEAVLSGSRAFKIHEDWGAAPRIIDTCLGVAEAADLPVALHTDTLNESGYLRDTLAATAGRTVHAYHVEGGGGHPDLLRIVEQSACSHVLHDADAAADPVHGVLMVSIVEGSALTIERAMVPHPSRYEAQVDKPRPPGVEFTL